MVAKADFKAAINAACTKGAGHAVPSNSKEAAAHASWTTVQV